MQHPERIGQYTIKRIIASGGMGIVYEAVQEKPRRTVALKVMKTSIASKNALRRFEYESQLLGRLTHPGIAQVYGAGTHDDGSTTVPYFAMEYVPDAKSIIEYAAEKNLGTRERLKIFAQVCDAVHHGHQKGIIHRDLKPGNILVNPEGQVKVIDFGVARSTDSDIALTTLKTDIGQLIGTLQYMSPEQCAADPNDIDTRSDVYALGVVLYELLCGHLPYDVKQKAFHEVTRVIREELPTRPSSISKRLRGDVETIALKALEKERIRRYQTAVELAQDIGRYLSGEAIIGRPPSMIYQMQIFARRHKVVFAALAAILIVLAVGLAVSTGMYFRAEQAREETVKERDRALLAEQESEKRRAEAEAVTTFLSETLAAVDPAEAQGKEVTVREMLDKAAEKIGESFAKQPLVEATLRTTMGNAYIALGEYDTAEPHLESALNIRELELGGDNIDTLRAMFDLAVLYQEQSRYDEEVSLHARVLSHRRHLLGENHLDTLASLEAQALIWSKQNLYDAAKNLQERILRIRHQEFGEKHPSTLKSMSVLSHIYLVRCHTMNLMKYTSTEQLIRRVLDLQLEEHGENHPETVNAMALLQSIYFYWNRLEEAETVALRELNIRNRIYGEKHKETINCMNDLGTIYVKQRRYDEGEVLFSKAYEEAKKLLGESHSDTMVYMSNWVSTCRDFTNRSEIDDGTQEYGPELMRRKFGKVVYYPSQPRNDPKFGEKNPGTSPLWVRIPPDEPVRGLVAYGTGLLDLGEYHKAESALIESYNTLLDNKGQHHPHTLDAKKLLTELYEAWGKPKKANQWRAKLSEGTNP